jgi:putative two-component system response regulator
MSAQTRIMVVDDEPGVVCLLQTMLAKEGRDVIPVSNGSIVTGTALRELPDLILLDVTMPGKNGFEVCRQLKRHDSLRDIPVIFLSGRDASEDKLEGFHAGGVDYITKPFNPDEVVVRVNTQLRLRSLQCDVRYQKEVEEKIREVSRAQAATIFALAKLAEYRDEDTGAHLERVRDYCRLIAERLAGDSPYAGQITTDFIECIQHAAPLHDIGKVAIPDSILLKPGKLTPEEFEIMKTHTVIGGENMQVVYNRYPGNAFIGMGIEIALYHHERWDGRGYPDRLVGRNIPLSARIIALADVYDALRSDRCYRKGFDREKTRTIILEEEDNHFDPEIVRAFLSLEDEFCRVQDFYR